MKNEKKCHLFISPTVVVRNVFVRRNDSLFFFFCSSLSVLLFSFVFARVIRTFVIFLMLRSISIRWPVCVPVGILCRNFNSCLGLTTGIFFCLRESKVFIQMILFFSFSLYHSLFTSFLYFLNSYSTFFGLFAFNIK